MAGGRKVGLGLGLDDVNGRASLAIVEESQPDSCSVKEGG